MCGAVPAEEIYFFDRERWPRAYAAIGGPALAEPVLEADRA
jgi:hypothetical protein